MQAIRRCVLWVLFSTVLVSCVSDEKNNQSVEAVNISPASNTVTTPIATVPSDSSATTPTITTPTTTDSIAPPTPSTTTPPASNPDEAGGGSDEANDPAAELPEETVCADISRLIGGRCIRSLAAESNQIEVDKEAGIIYFLAHNNDAVMRWNIEEKAFMDTIELGGVTPSSIYPNLMTFSAAHNRLYFAYKTGAVTYVDLAGGSETSLVNLPLEVGGLIAVGNFVMAQDASGAWNTHYVIDANGQITAQEEWNYNSDTYAWDSLRNRVYFYRLEHSPNDLHYETIDQVTGEISSKGETPYHGDYEIVEPLIVSETTGSVLIGSGNLFSYPALNWVGEISESYVDGLWTTDGLMVIETVGDKTIVYRRNDDLVLVEQVEFAGIALAMMKTSKGYSVLTRKDGVLSVSQYTPTSDTDGDTVLNISDAFPLDIAASVDTDKDGSPNHWNAGYSQADSTTGLVLDAYPQDDTCYLLSQGDGTHCNYSEFIPAFTPDSIVSDNNGTIYLLSSENNRVYRWSMETQNYAAPLVIGQDVLVNATVPTIMEFSASHERLYFGYEDGKISYLDLNNIEIGEQSFSSVPMAVKGLANVGNFLLVQDGSGSWETHYIYSKSGELMDSKDWNRFSKDYAWSEELSRVYFFRDGTSPNDVHYEEINQITGKITAAGESPYHTEYDVSAPVLVAPNNRVIIGSGNIYNAESLTWISALQNEFEQGVVLSNGDLLTLRGFNEQTWLDRYNASMNWVSEKDYVGSPLGIFEKDGAVYIITKTGDGMTFYQY